MGEIKPLTELAQRLHAGDPQAAGELFANYAQRLTHLAEQHLSRAMTARVDSEDVVQSVFRTFFRRHGRGEFRIDSTLQIWRLLVKITLLKVRAKARHHTAAKRDARVEVARRDDDWLHEAITQEPGPEEAASLVDQIETLLHGLPALHGQVLQLRLQGHTVAEIAPQLGVSRQTVYRTLDLLQQRLTRNAASEGG